MSLSIYLIRIAYYKCIGLKTKASNSFLLNSLRTKMTSPQYKKVLNNKGTIIEALKLTPGARGVLVTKFQEEEWLLITEDPTEEKLVNTVLGRIKRNPANITTFIDMLNDVIRLDQLVEN